MSQDDFFENMKLPQSSSNEDLETISNNLFRPLFDVKKFEIRSQNIRDKGIDFQIELKRENNRKGILYTNFHFAIQLKSTEKKINSDGTVSWQIETSNINYLLNNSMPAYYVLYHMPTDVFYFDDIKGFVKKLYDQNSNWNKQDSHTIKFSRKLDEIGLGEMYDTTLKKGKFQREINERQSIQTLFLNSGDKVVIDSDFNVSTDSEIRNFIENFGMTLLNELKWKEIIFIHKKASGNIAVTALYNLVLGMANYNNRNLVDSLPFFRTAEKLKNELTEEQKNYLCFFEATVKYSLGFISEDEFNSKMRIVENTKNIGAFIKFENAKKEYNDTLINYNKDGSEKFTKEINEILSDPLVDKNLKLNIECELILTEGFKVNNDYVSKITAINTTESLIGVTNELRADLITQFLQLKRNWSENTQAILKKTVETKNLFSYYSAIGNQVKVLYNYEVFKRIFFIKKSDNENKRHDTNDDKLFFEEILGNINLAFNYFNQIGHIQNAASILQLKYEILHFLEDFDNANIIFLQLEIMVENYDLPKNKLEYLRINGPTHIHFKRILENALEESKRNLIEREVLIKKMREMDEFEKKIDTRFHDERYIIQLSPIGYFNFPKIKKDTVYEILGVSGELQIDFDSLFAMSAIPIANIHKSKLTQVGPGKGILDDEGINSVRNFFRVRSAFFDNKFYRIM